jgi:hypothetical protein
MVVQVESQFHPGDNDTRNENADSTLAARALALFLEDDLPDAGAGSRPLSTQMLAHEQAVRRDNRLGFSCLQAFYGDSRDTACQPRRKFFTK